MILLVLFSDDEGCSGDNSMSSFSYVLWFVLLFLSRFFFHLSGISHHFRQESSGLTINDGKHSKRFGLIRYHYLLASSAYYLLCTVR